MDYIIVPKREFFVLPEYLKDSDLCVYGYFSVNAKDEVCKVSLSDIARHFCRSKHFAKDSISRLIRADLLVKDGNNYIIKKPAKRKGV